MTATAGPAPDPLPRQQAETRELPGQQAETRELPGIGTLELEHGPQGIRMWSRQPPPTSALLDTPVPLHVMLDGDDDLDQVDLALVAEVIGDVDRHLAAALRLVHRKLFDEPDFFGVTEAEVAPYREFRVESFPLEEPQFNFYPNAPEGSWQVHFLAGRFPVCDPFGLVVVVERRQPVDVEDISDAEILG
ncbi:hypothetical protein [Plantactinospora endophytica]|uniref:Uncharacterized protein n=1 Tax=Plantactinospora endophytica TaxID=673535 RepID=A0ABQ4E9I1_9ACTN|nr:hypothetical protein [Plantactinospora endophytica]GIG91391.1 hypothetical protein Pen02_63270 [Plantactinospora endophytica]